MKELLLCALNRASYPMTSADLADTAGALALDGFWSPRHLAGLSAQKVAGLMVQMEKGGEVEKLAGSSPPSWQLVRRHARDPNRPIPPPPEAKKNNHITDKWERPQIIALFDAQDETAALLIRQRKEAIELLDRQSEQFRELTKRVTRQLHAAGIDLE